MRRGLTPLRIGVPTLPPIPYTGTPAEMQRWIHQTYVELDLYFNKMKSQLVDMRGFMFVDQQVVGPAFTIEPTANYVDIYSADKLTELTSASDAAIALGVHSQVLVVTNVSGANLTLRHEAQTFMVAQEDLVLPPLHAASFRWDDASKVWTQFVML